MDAIRKKYTIISILIIISISIFTIIIKTHYDQYKKEESKVVSDNMKIAFLFELNPNNGKWLKGRNTDIIIEEFNKKDCKITFQEIQSAKVFYSDIKGNNKALESRKKIFEAIKKYKEVEQLGDIGIGALHTYIAKELDNWIPE